MKFGALPIGLKGQILDTKFKVINQFDIYGNVSAIIEDTDSGGTILVISNNSKKDLSGNVLYNYVNVNSKVGVHLGDEKAYKTRIAKFVGNLIEEVKSYNSGITKTEKRKPLLIKNKPMATKKQTRVEAARNFLSNLSPRQKKILDKRSKAVKKTTAARFVKGSKAAKDFMAKLRAKRSEGKYQYGETTKSRDKIIQAKKPGKRVAKKSKNVYYEYRANRADVDQRPKNKGGTLLGIGKHNSQKLDNLRLTRVNNDVNGNPRYVVHFLDFLNNEENTFLPFSKQYEYALKKAKKIGGRKFHNKQYGGGIIFQSYSPDDLKKRILDIAETTPKIKY